MNKILWILFAGGLVAGLVASVSANDKEMLTPVKGKKVKILACKKLSNLVDCEKNEQWTGKVLLNKRISLKMQRKL